MAKSDRFSTPASRAAEAGLIRAARVLRCGSSLS